MRGAAVNSFTKVLNPWLGEHIYIYIYVCVCVCVCVYVCVFNDAVKIIGIEPHLWASNGICFWNTNYKIIL